MTKIIVCGGRDFADRAFVYQALDSLHSKRGVTMLVHGAAKGADTLAEDWARSRQINYTGVPAKWDKLGKAAGYSRNMDMLQLNPDGVVAFSGGRGTDNMVRQARKYNYPVWDLRGGQSSE